MMAVISWAEYDEAHKNWVKHWASVKMQSPCAYHEFLGLDFTPIFGHQHLLGVVPDETSHKIHLLQGGHYGTVIIAWCIKNNHQWKQP